MEAQKVNVSFKFEGHSQFGEEVRITGNTESLGLWDVSQGVSLCTSSEEYPIWSTPSPILFAPSTSIEYKYTFYSSKGCRWESLEGNRELSIEKSDMLVEEQESDAAHKVTIVQTELPRNWIQSNEEYNFDIDESLKFDGSEPVMLVSLHLPISVSKTSEGSWDFALTATGWQADLYNLALRDKSHFIWVGWPHVHTEDEDEQEELAEILLEQFKCAPVFLNPQQVHRHERICQDVFFPLFHYIVDVDGSLPQYSSELWDAYKSVNSKFAETIIQYYTDQMIWIHDYQLLLAPSFISRRSHEVFNIGLSLHLPFPPAEVFMVLPHREYLLNSMLCCDLLCFHTFEYARNFIATCKRLLGIDHHSSRGGYLHLDYYGRHIMLRISHIGIDSEAVQSALSAPECQNLIGDLSHRYAGKKVVLSIDPVHRLSGVILKLKVLRNAMKTLHTYRKKIVFVQFLTPSQHSSQGDQQTVLQEIKALQAKINKEIGIEIIEFKHGPLPDAVKLAYMHVSVCFLNTAVRQGVCLEPFEFISVTRHKSHRVILSEFVGASRHLVSVRRVNPFDFNQVESEIYAVLRTSIGKSSTRPKLDRDVKYVNTNSLFNWAVNALTDLKRAQKDTEKLKYDTYGLGDKLKLIALKKNFNQLKVDSLIKAYKESMRRIFVFDYDGNLSTLFKEGGRSTKSLISSLSDICSDDRNTVYVLTHKEGSVLEEAFENLNIGLVAESGALVKANKAAPWVPTVTADFRWKDQASAIMKAYVNRTEGAWIVEKDFSIVFYHKNTDQELGQLQAKGLHAHLINLLKPYRDHCEVQNGLDYVEVRPKGINKGKAVFNILKEIKHKKGEVDFVLAVVDNPYNEQIFKMINTLQKYKSSLLSKNVYRKAFTCTIGRKSSLANYYVNDVHEVTQCLELLRGWSNKSKKNFSSGDLDSLAKSFRNYGRKKKSEMRKSPMFYDITESDEDTDFTSPTDIYKPRFKKTKNTQ